MFADGNGDKTFTPRLTGGLADGVFTHLTCVMHDVANGEAERAWTMVFHASQRTRVRLGGRPKRTERATRQSEVDTSPSRASKLDAAGASVEVARNRRRHERRNVAAELRDLAYQRA